MSACEKNSAVPEAGWEALVHGYKEIVRRQVTRSLRLAGVNRPRHEQIEEREQEVYFRLLTGGSGRLRRFQRWSEGQRVSYLSRVAQGVVADEMRARTAVKRGHGYRFTLIGRLCEIADRVVDERTPEREMLLREGRLAVLSRCRSLLDPKLCPEDRDRSLRILRRALLDGWSSEEIMQAEGGRLAASTIHSLVHRVRRRLMSPAWGTG
jgi:DNA-directed RNA polymerase specialized sigma24 family protein